eukprot:170133_1
MTAEGGHESVVLKVNETQKLPYGWERQIDDDGLVCYKNIITQEIQYEVPTSRAKPKPKQNKPKSEGNASTNDKPVKKKYKYTPSPESRKCIGQCIGIPYIKQYNEKYSNFNNKSSNCLSFCSSIGYNTISSVMSGGCMIILLPLAIIMDIFNLFLAIFLNIPPCCCGCCMYMSERGKVGFCCLGTFILRTSCLFICCEEGECNCDRACSGQADTNMYVYT